MQRHLNSIEDPVLDQRLASATLVCWLRTRQLYRLPGEADQWAAWRTGDAAASARCTARWRQRVLEPAQAEGRTVRAVHVVHTPMTPYMRFRMDCYWFTMGANEQVKMIVQAPGRWPQGVPRQDVLLADGPGDAGLVLLPHWTEGQGHLERAELTDEPQTVAWAREMCRRAWEHPLGRLLNALPLPYEG
jgi:hypothetical protein